MWVMVMIKWFRLRIEFPITYGINPLYSTPPENFLLVHFLSSLSFSANPVNNLELEHLFFVSINLAKYNSNYGPHFHKNYVTFLWASLWHRVGNWKLKSPFHSSQEKRRFLYISQPSPYHYNMFYGVVLILLFLVIVISMWVAHWNAFNSDMACLNGNKFRVSSSKKSIKSQGESLTNQAKPRWFLEFMACYKHT